MLLAIAALVLVATGVAVTAAAATGAVGRAGHAGQAADGLILSRDQISWTADLEAPLFLPGLAWSPGDVRATTFFVRNDTDEVSDVSIAIRRSVSADPLTDRYITMSASPGTQAGGGAGVTVLPADDQGHLVLLRDLRPGDYGAVTMQVSLSPAAPAGTQVDGDTLDFRASLTSPEDAGGFDGFGSAAHLQLAPLFLGFALVGAAVVVWRRRGVRAARPHA